MEAPETICCQTHLDLRQAIRRLATPLTPSGTWAVRTLIPKTQPSSTRERYALRLSIIGRAVCPAKAPNTAV